MSRFDKSRLPSRHVTEGAEKAPMRAMLLGTGLAPEDLDRPLIRVATTWSETSPCNMPLDGIAMGHSGMKASLVSREVVAHSIELVVRGHYFDAIVGLAGCDKTLPGVTMAMVRMNVPAVFLYGGS